MNNGIDTITSYSDYWKISHYWCTCKCSQW